jgi:hypothetical protein
MQSGLLRILHWARGLSTSVRAIFSTDVWTWTLVLVDKAHLWVSSWERYTTALVPGHAKWAYAVLAWTQYGVTKYLCHSILCSRTVSNTRDGQFTHPCKPAQCSKSCSSTWLFHNYVPDVPFIWMYSCKQHTCMYVSVICTEVGTMNIICSP